MNVNTFFSPRPYHASSGTHVMSYVVWTDVCVCQRWTVETELPFGD